MAYQFFDSQLIDVIEETPTTRRYIIEVSEIDHLDFKAGQFVMLDLPIDSKITTRSYSIASAPNGSNRLELVIVLKDGGLGTTYLFDKAVVKPGIHLKVSAPIGKFTLPEELDSEICFICTGTGIAPFRAMLLDIKNHKLPHPPLKLIFGSRFEKDILYREEFEKLQSELPDFEYYPVLSREKGESWKGDKGYVHEVYKRLYADARPAHFYICGWKEMIMEAKQNLLDMGYDKKDIKFELYD